MLSVANVCSLAEHKKIPKEKLHKRQFKLNVAVLSAVKDCPNCYCP